MNLEYITRIGTMIPLTQVQKGDEFDFYIHGHKDNTVPWIATEDYSADNDSVQCYCIWSDGRRMYSYVYGYEDTDSRTAHILSVDNVVEEEGEERVLPF